MKRTDELLSIELVNYLGLESRSIEKFDAERVKQIELLNASPGQQLTAKDASVSINQVNKHVWLRIPIDTDYDDRIKSPARRSHSLKALLYWQVIFFLLFVLRPVLIRAEKPVEAR